MSKVLRENLGNNRWVRNIFVSAQFCVQVPSVNRGTQARIGWGTARSVQAQWGIGMVVDLFTGCH